MINEKNSNKNTKKFSQKNINVNIVNSFKIINNESTK